MEAYFTYFKTLLESWDDLKCTICNRDQQQLHSDLLIQRAGIYCVMDIHMRVFFVSSEHEFPYGKVFILREENCKQEHVEQYKHDLTILLGLLDVSTWRSFLKLAITEDAEVDFGDANETELKKVVWSNQDDITVWFNASSNEYNLKILHEYKAISVTVPISEEKAKVVYDLALDWFIEAAEVARQEVIRFKQYMIQ